MGKSPAQREKEQRRAERLAGQRVLVEDRRLRRRRIIVLVVVVALVLPLAGSLVVAVFAADGPASSTAEQGDEEDTSLSSVAPQIPVTLPPPGAAVTGETPCPPPDGSAERTTAFAGPPPTCIDLTMQHRAVIHTTEGDLEYLLHTEFAPVNVNNFVVLARYGFYDGVPFYGIEPRKVLLTGDATGDPVGEGGPGYTVAAEVPEAGAIYPAGTLAMWADPPGRHGSRFLIAAGDQAAALEPDHTPIGLLLDGTETLANIQFLGDVITGKPIGEVRITSIEIIEEPRPAGAEDASTTGPATTEARAATTVTAE